MITRDTVNTFNFPPSFHAVLDAQEVKGIEKYGQRLTTDSPIDADEYAQEEIADLVMYLTLAMERERNVMRNMLYKSAILLLRDIWRGLWG